MATIRTAIQVNDMMSQQFRAMNMAMSTVIDSFHTLQDATSQAVDVAALEAAQRELQQVEANFNQIEHEIRRADAAQDKFNQEIREADSLANKLLGTLGTIAGTYLTLQGIENAINLSDEMTNIEARLNLVLDEKPLLPELEVDVKLNFSTSDMSEVDQLQEMIFDSAKRAYAPYLETADLVGKLSMNASDAFGSAAETVAFAELLNKSFSNAGTNAEGIASATLQLTQALGAGALRGEELNAVLEAAPGIVQNIEKYLNISRGELREMASDGEITAEIVKQSMFAAADDINRKFESMPVTWSQIWTNFQSDALKAFQPVLQEINNLANNQKVQEFVASVSQSLYVLSQITLSTIQILSSIGGFIYENWAYAEPVIVAVTIALLAYGAAQLWVNREVLISAALTATETMRKWAHVVATIAQTAATYGLTGAMGALGIAIATNPIGWLIGAIVVLVLVFYAAVAAVNYFTGESYSATGLIAGFFATLGAFIANVFMGLLEIVLGVIEAQYNRWIAFANFFGNVFNDPIASIIHLFGDLGDNVLGVIEKIASALDFVFGSNLASTVAGWRSDLMGLVNWAADEYGNGQYEVLYKELDIDQVMADLGLNMKRFEYSSAWNTGYDWGADLFNGMDLDASNAQSFDDLFNSIGGLQDAIDTGNMDGKDTAGNTKKLADSVDMAKDDLAYLRDIAERESINRYTTAEIKVDMKNENHIHHDTDIDGIVDRFGEKVEEVISVLAEGDGDDV